LGWVTPGMMVPEFDKQMQEIPVGEISEPFQTHLNRLLQVLQNLDQLLSVYRCYQ
jgi:peptidyl-prolyl cis-trans isomerase SurA